MAIRMLLIFIMFLTLDAHAFTAGQQEKWDIAIREAQHRARDFRKFRNRKEQELREREKAAVALRRQREKQEAELEKARIEYVVERNSRPSDEARQAKLEKEYEEQLERERKVREAERRAFTVGRDRFLEKLEKEASIDEAEEYDVHSWLKPEASVESKDSGRSF